MNLQKKRTKLWQDVFNRVIAYSDVDTSAKQANEALKAFDSQFAEQSNTPSSNTYIPLEGSSSSLDTYTLYDDQSFESALAFCHVIVCNNCKVAIGVGSVIIHRWFDYNSVYKVAVFTIGREQSCKTYIYKNGEQILVENKPN